MSHLYFNGPRSVFLLVNSIGNRAIEFSYGTKLTLTPRMLKTQFGDGYAQRSSDGINNRILSGSLAFDNRSDKFIKELANFFRGIGTFYPREPHEYFYMIPPPPFDGDGTYLKFINDTAFDMAYNQFNNSTISVPVMQVFDP